MAEAITDQILIPEPNGRYAVGYVTAQLTDTTRIDPEHGNRRVMVSLFYPIERSAAAPYIAIPYMPPLVSTFLDMGLSSAGLPKVCGRMRLQVSNGVDESATRDVWRFPLVLFSPGLTFTRHQHNAMAQDIASQGYAVVTMDHTREAMVVEWPDGTHTRGNIPPNIAEEDAAKHRLLLEARVLDARFVLTQLESLRVVQQLVPNARAPFDTEKAVILGHSFGGATAISALMQDVRFRGAINMDGSQYGPMIKTWRPVVLFGRGQPNPRNRRNNLTWENLAKHLECLREVNLNNAAHNTFSDLPLIFKLCGIETEGFAKEMAGTEDGERSFTIITAYIKDFLDLVLKKGKGELYSKPSEEYPEIEVMSTV